MLLLFILRLTTPYRICFSSFPHDVIGIRPQDFFQGIRIGTYVASMARIHPKSHRRRHSAAHHNHDAIPTSTRKPYLSCPWNHSFLDNVCSSSSLSTEGVGRKIFGRLESVPLGVYDRKHLRLGRLCISNEGYICLDWKCSVLSLVSMA